MPKKLYKISGRKNFSRWLGFYLKIFFIFKLFSPFKFYYFSKIINLISMIYKGNFFYILDILNFCKLRKKTIKNFLVYCLIFISLYKYVQSISVYNSKVSFFNTCKDLFIYLFESICWLIFLDLFLVFYLHYLNIFLV